MSIYRAIGPLVKENRHKFINYQLSFNVYNISSCDIFIPIRIDLLHLLSERGGSIKAFGHLVEWDGMQDGRHCIQR